VIVRFINIDGIVDHHLFKVIVRFVDIDGIVDHHLFLKQVMVNNSTNINKANIT
jgi:L-fucose mutarotase/ribose pyranase (RbsD/FucU family)